MPNKNSIESEIEDLLSGWRQIVLSEYDGTSFVAEEMGYIDEAIGLLKNLIQREVKKGRVEEWERVLKAKVTHGGTPGFFNPEGLPIETSRTQQLTEVMQRYAKDRLEELEG